MGTAAASAHQPASPSVTSGGTWHNIQQLPGIGDIGAVSCTSPGNCGAGGSGGAGLPSVVTQTKGKWGTAEPLPGMAALGATGGGISSMSCWSAGNCGAAGLYTDSAGNTQVFVAAETNGTWGDVQAVPGLAALNNLGEASVAGLGCGKGGNCTLAGDYTSSSKCPQLTCGRSFVAAEKNGTWGPAKALPGIAGTSAEDLSTVAQLSCASTGNCAVTGRYNVHGAGQGFVADETHGKWAKVIPIPGLAALAGPGGIGVPLHVSCGAPGSCSAGGFYSDGNDNDNAFVVTETNGTWGTAIEVPGTAQLNTKGNAEVQAISCTTPGNCSASGIYTTKFAFNDDFVVDEVNGVWGTAIQVPGTAQLNTGGGTVTSTLSCSSPGNCSAGGYYEQASGSRFEAFVVTETNGTWGTAIEVPGTAQLNTSPVEMDSMSCTATGKCTAAGHFNGQAFAVSES